MLEKFNSLFEDVIDDESIEVGRGEFKDVPDGNYNVFCQSCVFDEVGANNIPVVKLVMTTEDDLIIYDTWFINGFEGNEEQTKENLKRIGMKLRTITGLATERNLEELMTKANGEGEWFTLVVKRTISPTTGKERVNKYYNDYKG